MSPRSAFPSANLEKDALLCEVSRQTFREFDEAKSKDEERSRLTWPPRSSFRDTVFLHRQDDGTSQRPEVLPLSSKLYVADQDVNHRLVLEGHLRTANNKPTASPQYRRQPPHVFTATIIRGSKRVTRVGIGRSARDVTRPRRLS